MKHLVDAFGKRVCCPQNGFKVWRDNKIFTVIQVVLNEDINIIASITLRGDSGDVEVGYYDFLKHPIVTDNNKSPLLNNSLKTPEL
jgi:hypothetical protein